MKNNIIITILLVISMFLVACGSTSAPSPSEMETSQKLETEDTQNDERTVPHGDIISWNENEIDGKDVLVVKIKIRPNMTNELTVKQNYYNVADIIKNQGGDSFGEIQYWAVADMSDGSESKVVSFTLDTDAIQSIANGDIAENQIDSVATDLFIHKSLQ